MELKSAKLVNRKDIWDWCSENNIWHPYDNFKLTPHIRTDQEMVVSFPEERKVVRIGNVLSLKLIIRNFEKVPFFLDFFQDKKDRVDISNIQPYDGNLLFDIEDISPINLVDFNIFETGWRL